jgi:outer membrane biosynthesis protein TonB
MRPRDLTFTIALCASLALHGWLVSEGMWRYTLDNLHIYFDGYRDRPVFSTLQEDDQLGAQAGRGDAIDEAPGETLLQARQNDQTQILGSLDPEGFGRMRQDKPSDSVLPTGGSVMKPQPSEATDQQPAFGVAAAPMSNTPFGIGDAKPAPSESEVTPSATSGEASAAAQQARASDSPQLATAQTPGAPAPSADPAPKAETESDPVSLAGSAIFKNGKTYVQFGRKHRLTYPRMTLAGETSLLRLSPPVIIVMKINLDAQGNVTRVEIVKSSGSIDIDQPCLVAAYTWWLEPKRDRNNNAVEDEFLFTLRFS